MPPSREEDTVLLELGSDFPIGLPFFDLPDGVSPATGAQVLFDVLKTTFPDLGQHYRMAELAYAVVATLAGQKGATPLDVLELVRDPAARRRWLAGISDPLVSDYWRDFESLSPSAQREVAAPLLHRLRALVRSSLRLILCQTQGIKLRSLLERHSLVLVNLAGPSLQGETDLLTRLLLAQVHLAALARLDRPPEQRSRVYVATDEAHRHGGSSLPLLLREGRNLAVTTLLATQHLAALEEGLTESALANVNTMLVFRLGDRDARRLAPGLRPFTAEQLQELDRFHAVVKMQANSTTLPAFEVRTLPVAGEWNEARLERIRRRSRELYARPRREVEEELNRRFNSSPRGWERFDVDEE